MAPLQDRLRLVIVIMSNFTKELNSRFVPKPEGNLIHQNGNVRMAISRARNHRMQRLLCINERFKTGLSFKNLQYSKMQLIYNLTDYITG
jgi:hypothetical protein